MGKVGCDIWEKWVGGRKTKTLKRKFINIGAGKTHAVETFEKRRTRRRKRRQMNGCISRVSSIKVRELVLKWGAGIQAVGGPMDPTVESDLDARARKKSGNTPVGGPMDAAVESDLDVDRVWHGDAKKRIGF